LAWSELGGDLSWFSGKPVSGQDALQSTIENADDMAFNEWIGVDRYDDTNLWLVLHNEDALSPVLAGTRLSNDDYLPGVDWAVKLFAVFHRPLSTGIAENMLNVFREGVLSEERGSQTSRSARSIMSPRISKLIARHSCQDRDGYGSYRESSKYSDIGSGDGWIHETHPKDGRTKANNTRIQN
jgi:hypothetical protein